MSNEMLIRCCAPTMASLKTGNMFNCPFDSKEEMTVELRRLNQVLGPKGLRIIPLRWNDGRALVYLYRLKMLEKDLQNDLATQLLAECGYTCGNPNGCFAQLVIRLRDLQEFPHEVGLFLGYPPADVDGFMHQRYACKLSGIWKVYDDVEGATRQFARCKRCTEVYLQRYRQGYSLDRLTVTA
jgi:hypothetical protein